MARITDSTTLQAMYGEPSPLVIDKVVRRLDKHCRTLLARSPFYVIATRGADGLCDATPRGDAPGGIVVLDDKRLMLPDWPGNRRLDTLHNLIHDPAIGLLFLLPGVRETLRVNGTAEVRDDEDLRARFETDGKTPRTVVVVTVAEAYIQCGKASVRSRIWEPESWVKPGELPPLAEVLRDHTRIKEIDFTEEELVASYRAELY